MKKVRQYNKYGIESGGYIADMMDRAAHEHLCDLYPEYKYWLTSSAKVTYYRQSDGEAPKIVIKDASLVGVFGHRTVRVMLIEFGTWEIVARGTFKFVGKNKLAIQPQSAPPTKRLKQGQIKQKDFRGMDVVKKINKGVSDGKQRKYDNVPGRFGRIKNFARYFAKLYRVFVVLCGSTSKTTACGTLGRNSQYGTDAI